MMELGLSLGDSSRPNFIGLMEKGSEGSSNNQQLGLGFNTTLSIGPIITVQKDQQEEQEEEKAKAKKENNSNNQRSEDHHEGTNNGFHQLDLLPKLSFPWHPPSQNGTVLSSDIGGNYSGGLDVNVLPVATVVAAAEEEGEALSSSPSASSFQMELCMYSRGGSGSGKRENSDGEAYEQSCHQRASDEDDNGGNTRKKLRLSKEQSAFLEESFKEHHTLNPKQKLALARQLNLRPRQVEVWFQNRRARTKLKQTEVDCEYLKRCCETLTEENRRLHKELQELRALKSTSNSNPFYMQLPATTLTMCPSCERVATNNSTSTITTTTSTSAISNIAPTPKTLNNGNENSNSNSKAVGFPFGNKPIFHPFGNSTSQPQPHQSTPS